MIQISVGYVQSRSSGPGEIVGLCLFLRRNGKPWRPPIELGVFRVEEEESFEDMLWTTISILTWREVHVILAKIMQREREDVRHAMLRAIPPTPAAVRAQVDDLDVIGKAYAEYVWAYIDIAVGGSSKQQSARIEVNENGGMAGGATFQGIAPYPVPGYDLAWIDPSPGG